MSDLRVLIRGGGDLGSGVGVRLYRAGAQVVFTELAMPLVVRRFVSFAEAVISGSTFVEEVKAQKATSKEEVFFLLEQQIVPVLIDPQAETIQWLKPDVLVDARLRKVPPEINMEAASLVIGLGPGFTVGLNCHAIVETKRGPTLGRVYWNGTAEADSGLPEGVNGYVEERVLRAPRDGYFNPLVRICDFVTKGQPVAEVGGVPIVAQFDGVIRGLVVEGLPVTKGMKVGDVDPRKDPRLCNLVSDKSLAVGGGALEAVLSIPELRRKLC
ncbi:selenium-dependent molybdenum hydroxylase system protein, YqeB family [Bellilinea caldifistulae]|uniref:selenium-dependent molybdenum cofactor biosynthesis protein YqeB n=1 Tax=Bellilinea caldifistulae TaxID=360411 RepID=UPI000780E956|nr:selenium-dependent molybdenum cofactor biosynthesis protein YqeB [Bellilinea caldifistulae]GAP10854.1 selenium-dependent molybdenum hydroxylase system protein, YqeB family [Bellilinea caldifistulae]